ncbi:hypothetical protein R2F25_38250 [Streptomyces sp. UP1A-1]|nr:hypothetical protein [Streptomyces sp. UP1A-1]
MPAGWRYIAVRATGGRVLGDVLDPSEPILDWEVPLALTSNPRRDLSGPGSMNGTIEPEYTRMLGDDKKPILQEWGTELYLEVDGRLRWGGLVTKTTYDGPKATINCEGFTAYPQGIPYEDHMISGALITPKDPYAKQGQKSRWLGRRQEGQGAGPAPAEALRRPPHRRLRRVPQHLESRPVPPVREPRPEDRHARPGRASGRGGRLRPVGTGLVEQSGLRPGPRHPRPHHPLRLDRDARLGR